MIRTLTIAMLVAGLLPHCVEAQDGSDDRATYEVALTEFRLKSGHAPESSSEEIIRDFHDRDKKDNLEVVETLRLTVQSDLECRVQFGKRLQVTKGIVNNPRGVQRVTQTMEVGTVAQIRVAPKNGKLLLQLDYSASRLAEDGPEDGPPDVFTSTYQATMAIEKGKPTLVGGMDSDSASYLIIYVR